MLWRGALENQSFIDMALGVSVCTKATFENFFNILPFFGLQIGTSLCVVGSIEGGEMDIASSSNRTFTSIVRLFVLC